jgi:hypothetical protein
MERFTMLGLPVASSDLFSPPNGSCHTDQRAYGYVL